MTLSALVLTSPRWTLGILVGLPFVALGLVLWVAAAVALARKQKRAADLDLLDPDMCRFGKWVFRVIAVIWIGAFAAGYYPWTAQYHQWRPVTGTVTQVSNRILSGDEGVSQRYVFVINGQPYGVDDTRASLVKVGDTIHLACVRDWQFSSQPGYVCNWNQ